MFSKIKSDLPASIAVFLVALPLCLGVALASGAPLLSGIISGVVGGIVVGYISRSNVSVSGPAAGLTAVVLSSITKLGTFEAFLLALVIAGVIQYFMGILRGGVIANYIPATVIKGLLAAIGIILILKQIPHAFGYDDVPEEDFSFAQADHENTFSELLNILNYFSYGAIVVTICSLLIMIYWNKIPFSWLKRIPASLFVVLMGISLNAFFHHFTPFLYIHNEIHLIMKNGVKTYEEINHLVHIPEINSISSIITFPDFKSIGNYQVWLVAITLAAIASLETLLNLEAVENIDPKKRIASPNRELVAQGIGNVVSGLLGGIPVTSIIVRGSVNINAGAETKMSTILHGVLLLVSILLLSPFLNQIPLASLAAILILTGYKLAKISIFIEKFKKGMKHFIPFIATIIAILFTDLLIGVIIGLIISIGFLLVSNYRNPFKIKKERVSVKETIKIELPNQVSFLNKASIKKALWKLPNDSNVILDARYSDYIDDDIIELIKKFKNTIAVENNINLNIFGLNETFHIEDQVQFVNVIEKEDQEKLSADDVLEILKEGNKRFAAGDLIEKYYSQQINATSNNQNPIAVVVSCIDSRTSPEIIFDLGLGDVISIRIAGNIINEEILGSIEFACQKIGTKLIVVLGHSNCGAVTYAIGNKGDGNVASITSKIAKAVHDCNCDSEALKANPTLLDKVIKANTTNSIAEILSDSPYLKEQIDAGKVKMVSGFYDTTNGMVLFD
jgi:MFS superfamily sulfate permease-like transporter